MNHHLDPEVVVSFISEAKGYLPEIMLGLEAFAANPDHAESIKEAFRYAHIIKGAASMLGLSHISELAYQLEVTLEMISEGHRNLSPDLLEYLCQVISDIADLLDLALPKVEGAELTPSEAFAVTPMPVSEPVAHEEFVAEVMALEEHTDDSLAYVETVSEHDDSQPVSADLPFPVISLTPPELPSDEFGETVIQGAPESLPPAFFPSVQIADQSNDEFEDQNPVEILTDETQQALIAAEENTNPDEVIETVDASFASDQIEEVEAVAEILSADISEAEPEVYAEAEPLKSEAADSVESSAIMPAVEMAELTEETPLDEAFDTSAFTISLPETEETQTIGELNLNDVADDLKNAYGAFPPPPQPEFDIPSELISLPEIEGAVLPYAFSGNNEAEILEVAENAPENYVFDNYEDTLADDLLADTASALPVAQSEMMPLPPTDGESEELLPLPELPALTDDLPAFSAVSETELAMTAAPEPETLPEEEPAQANFASEVSDELLEVFMLEAEEHLQTMQTSLRGLEKTPGNRDLIQEVRRSAHSLKGTAAMIGFRNIMQLAHRMEDLLDLIFDGEIKLTPGLNRLLTEATDALEDMSNGNTNQAVVSRLYEEFTEALNNPPVDDATTETTVVTDAAETDLMLPDFALETEEIDPAAYEAELALPDILLSSMPALPEADNETVLAPEELLETSDFTPVATDEQTEAQLEDVLDDMPSMQMETDAAPITESFVADEPVEIETTPVKADLASGNVTNSFTEFAITNASTPAFNFATEKTAAFVAESPAILAPISESGEVVKSADIVQAPQPTTTAQPTSQFVRVPIERLDEVVKLISEMIITRTAFEQRMGEFAHQVEELQITSARLRRASSTLESKYEVTTLGGGRPFFSSRQGMLPTVGNAPFGLNETLTNKQTHGFDDLEFDRYTEFHLLSRELGEASSDIQTLGRELGHLNTDFLSYLNRQGRIYSELQDRLMRLRMVPLANLAPRLHRTVRTVGAQQNKQVELILEGENTAIDTTALQEVVDPLLHLLRNAVDHGIENALERQAKGKPALGKIKLRAFYEGSQVVLQLTDDGKGLDLKKIRETAIKNGYLTAQEVDSMSSHELWSLIFTPGFSTADHVSEISGRGVGMDIVHTTIQKLKGTISVDSQFGHGTTFTIRLPLTLAVTRALMVKANTQNFAIPLDVVTQIMRVETDKIERIGKEPVIRVAGKVYPLLMLSRLLNMKSMADEIGKRPPALMLNIEGKEVVVIVDQLLGGREIVIKTLGTHLRKVHGVMGATLMGDGEVVLILNLAELLRGTVRPIARRTPTIKVGSMPEASKALPAAEESNNNDSATKAKAEKQVLTVLVVDDSPSVRRVSSNLIKSVGWIPVQAKDGLDALDQLQSGETLPDLVMLDIEMPRMDGYQLLASLRALPVFRNLPIVIVSSRSSDKHRQKAFDLGATEYLVKPYQDDQVVALIRRLVKEAHL